MWETKRHKISTKAGWVIPKITTYDSSQRLSTESPQVQQSVELAQASGKQIAQVGEVVADASFKFMKAQNDADILREKTEAKIFAKQKITDLQTRLETDPNFDPDKSPAEYASEFKKIQVEAMGMFKNKKAQEQFSNEFRLDVIGDAASLQKGIFKRKIDILSGARATELEQVKLDAVNSGDIEGGTKAILNHINEDEKNFLISSNDAAKKSIKEVNDFKTKAFLRDLSRNSEMALKRVEENYYLVSDDKTLASMKATAQKQKRRDEVMAKAAEEKKFYGGAVKAANEYMEGTLTQERIYDMVKEEGLDPNDAESFSAALFAKDLPKSGSKNYKPSADAVTYISMIDSGRYSDRDVLMQSLKGGVAGDDLGYVLQAIEAKKKPEKWKEIVSVVRNAITTGGNPFVSELVKVDGFFENPMSHFEKKVSEAMGAKLSYEKAPKYLVDGFGFVKELMTQQTKKKDESK